MTDDPREVLKAAGVECAEVEAFVALGDVFVRPEEAHFYLTVVKPDVPLKADAAILALACLVAEYKTECATRTLENQHLADLASERSQAAKKYKWQRDAVLDRYVRTVEGEWGISHWRDDERQPTGDDGYLTDDEAREKWKVRVVDDLGKDTWDELLD